MTVNAANILAFSAALLICLTINHPIVFSQSSLANSAATTINLKWRDPPLDNPLRGLVPYASQMPWVPEGDNQVAQLKFTKSMAKVFPHSVEFFYISLAELMEGNGKFDWAPLENRLKQISGRGCQCTFRVFLEYPGKTNAIPQFLIDDGLKVRHWKSEDGEIHTPDYEDPRIRKAMRQFIAAMGERYDGDARIAWLTVGMLGLWGEWHDYPKEELFASKEVQTEIMDAYEAAFNKTKLHLRYPAGDQDYSHAANAERDFGYHDDSFAWATIPTGKSEDDWFFGSLLESAGPAAVDKWKSEPIGGEIRPETWGCVFEEPGCAPKGQEFDKCVQHTHVSWLMDSGMFLKPQPKKLIDMAKKKTASMGYQLTIESATLKMEADNRSVYVKIGNRGVAPFYYRWTVETVLLDSNNHPAAKIANDWKLPEVMPGEVSSWRLLLPEDAPEVPRIGIRVPNPMSGGFPLRFANEEQMLDGDRWLVLDFSRRAD